jgi:hypothetical protein
LLLRDLASASTACRSSPARVIGAAVEIFHIPTVKSWLAL